MADGWEPEMCPRGSFHRVAVGWEAELLAPWALPARPGMSPHRPIHKGADGPWLMSM